MPEEQWIEEEEEVEVDEILEEEVKHETRPQLRVDVDTDLPIQEDSASPMMRVPKDENSSEQRRSSYQRTSVAKPELE